jgi:hypothetical protein
MAVAVCRALTVLCVAPDHEALTALRAATVSAEWELTPGAIDVRSALDRIDADRPHVMVAFGAHGDLVAIVRERFPSMRIITDRETPGATVVATSIDEVRDLVLGLSRPGGPVGA